MSDKILFVDDEPNVLDGLRRQLRKRFDVATALGGEAGLATIESEGPFAVIVSDMKMPGMNGAQFLAEARRRDPDGVRMVLSGQSELNSAIDAVNHGHIFRFLTKPCDTETLVQGLETAVEQYRLKRVERELLEQTLSGAVHVLTQVLSLVSPEVFSRTSRIRHYAEGIAERLGFEPAWQIRVAALLSQIGCITLPQEVLAKVGTPHLTEDEAAMFRAHPGITSKLIESIPRLEGVSQMIEGQLDSPELEGLPDDPAVLGSQILRAAILYESRLSSGRTRVEVLEELARPEQRFPREIVDAARSVRQKETETVAKTIGVAQLKTQMILDEDVKTKTGMLLVPRGEEVTVPMIGRLRNFARGHGIEEPFRVLVSA